MVTLLLKSLKDKLEASLSSLMLVSQLEKSDVAKPPKIMIGDLKNNESSNSPYVLIEANAGHFSINGSQVAINLHCFVSNPKKNDSSEVENDLMLLISKINTTLINALDSKGEPLAKRFLLIPDKEGKILPWEKKKENPSSFRQITITSTWFYKNWE